MELKCGVFFLFFSDDDSHWLRFVMQDFWNVKNESLKMNANGGNLCEFARILNANVWIFERSAYQTLPNFKEKILRMHDCRSHGDSPLKLTLWEMTLWESPGVTFIKSPKAETEIENSIIPSQKKDHCPRKSLHLGFRRVSRFQILAS